MATLEEIIEYVKKYKDSHPQQTLRDSLKKQQVPEEIIEKAFASVMGGESPAGYAPPKAPPVAPSAMGFILVVDDEPAIRDLLVDKLCDAGYRAVSANDGMQSLIQAEGMKLSLVISDIQMPGFGTGVEAVQKMRQSPQVSKNLPVIFLTGMSPEEARKIVPLDDPYVRLLHKPVDWELLKLYMKDLTGMDKPL